MSFDLLCSDKGMKYLTNTADWVDLFDVVVVQARKPKFYSDNYRSAMYPWSVQQLYSLPYRPFRSLDPKNNAPNWVKVSEFVKSRVYQEVKGQLKLLKKISPVNRET